ncbi:hypothetical protein J4E90_001842 [Alternaria incomplexa]|nr:uncharacterized protein J4E90_001842 [Alternaria incomplexa]KAI4919705.1 hypothetical protein J4E90_001842 [Alternaria incomplexa]
MTACYIDSRDYHPGEDPKNFTFCDASKRMLVAKDPVTGKEVWMGVHINKTPGKDDFELEPSFYSSPSSGEQSHIVEPKAIKITEDKTTEGEQPNGSEVKTTDPEALFFDVEKEASLDDLKAIAAMIARVLKFTVIPPPSVISDMREWTAVTGFSIWAAPLWEMWLIDHNQKIPEPAVRDPSTAEKEAKPTKN